jgi:hypothetical protein
VLTLQFAYDFTPDQHNRLDDFLGGLPRGPRYAVEVRNRGWLKPDMGEMLSQHNVALVLQDLFYMPKLDWITADFTVIRWLGRRQDIENFDRIQIDRAKCSAGGRSRCGRSWMTADVSISTLAATARRVSGSRPIVGITLARRGGEPSGFGVVIPGRFRDTVGSANQPSAMACRTSSRRKAAGGVRAPVSSATPSLESAGSTCEVNIQQGLPSSAVAEAHQQPLLLPEEDMNEMPGK